MRPRDSIAGRATALQRTTLIAVFSTLLGCDVTDPPTTEPTAAERFATSAWPALGRCVGCHGSQPTIDFLAPGTADGAYASVFAYQPPVVDVASPTSSLLLAMGKHTGPPLLPAEADALLRWIEAERVVRVPDELEPIVIGPVALALGEMNRLDLGHGASLQFVPTPAAAGLSLAQLEVIAGPAGLEVAHPLFASQPADGAVRVDTADRFGDLELELGPRARELLGGGAVVFTTFAPNDPLTIHFRTLEAP